MATIIIENAKGERAPRKAKIIIENAPVKYKRPKTTDSTMFVSFDGKLYSGYYLMNHQNKALEVLRYFQEINN